MSATGNGRSRRDMLLGGAAGLAATAAGGVQLAQAQTRPATPAQAPARPAQGQAAGRRDARDLSAARFPAHERRIHAAFSHPLIKHMQIRSGNVSVSRGL